MFLDANYKPPERLEIVKMHVVATDRDHDRSRPIVWLWTIVKIVIATATDRDRSYDRDRSRPLICSSARSFFFVSTKDKDSKQNQNKINPNKEITDNKSITQQMVEVSTLIFKMFSFCLNLVKKLVWCLVNLSSFFCFFMSFRLPIFFFFFI